MKSLLVLLLSSFLSFAQAQVWVDRESWSQEWEQRFAAFVSSERVNTGLFTASNSPYKGIRADCADASYALRAIFAFENGLPFALRNPSGVRAGQPAYANFNNRIDRFNSIRSPQQRFVAFLNYIGSSVGSENLTRQDTFPVAIDALRSGDIFSYRITRTLGGFFRRTNQYIRHVYNIKNINPTGTFDVIYSTQAIADQGLPMIRRREREFVNLPFDAWGFRRFRWPEHLGKPVSAIPASLGRSNQQYDMVAEYGDRFFREVRKKLSSIEETPEQSMQRALGSLCIEAQARVEYVNQGLQFLASIGGRCMDYTQYDAYSTPARDEALNQSFLRAKETYDDIVRSRLDGQLTRTMINFARAIFYNQSGSESELRSFCPITYKARTTIDLAELRRRQVAGRLSSHPNDTVEHRWGESTRVSRTRCTVHY
jgi:hypothetical protein